MAASFMILLLESINLEMISRNEQHFINTQRFVSDSRH